MSFVIHCGIRNDIVVLQSLGIDTDLCVKSNESLSGFCPLGGDHNNTVSTTGTIKGVGSSILENGHGLNVVGIDI